MWTANPHRFTLPAGFELVVLDDAFRVFYPVEGATLTALQITKNGEVLPIGRAQVANGVAELSFVEVPEAGRPFLLSASAAGGVSVLLAPEPGTLATGLAAALVLAGLRASRRSSRRSASSGAIRRAQSARQGFPSYS